jgi:hypothetical protein
MCLATAPSPTTVLLPKTSCPATVALLMAQLKELPRAQQQEVLQQLHDLVYHPYYTVLVGPDYR